MGQQNCSRQPSAIALSLLSDRLQPREVTMANLFDLHGRIALITGSAGGIGYALAKGLAEAGARAVLNDRDSDRLSGAAATLAAEGLSVEQAIFDVTRSDEVRAAIDRVEREVGPIDILVNNAGMQRRSPLEEFPEEDWHRMMALNLDSMFIVSQAVVRHMIPRRRGNIINICSVQSELGRPGIAPYAATKGAVKMLTKGMAIDWGKYGIRVNGLGPGYFKTALTANIVADEVFSGWLTNRTPLGRWGDVEELVGGSVFLASDASSFVTGHVLYVDGGVTAQL
jgi:gluconate 5-dehydrogenase